jgi:hypothetical protein
MQFFITRSPVLIRPPLPHQQQYIIVVVDFVIYFQSNLTKQIQGHHLQHIDNVATNG